MTDIMKNAQQLKADCLRVMHAMEESDGSSRANGGEADNFFKDIPSWFAPYAHLPDHVALRSQAKTLVLEVCKTLNKDWPPPPGYSSKPVDTNPELAYADKLTEDLKGWTGQAAVNFRTNYLLKFPEFTKNLYTATFVAAQTLNAEAKLWETAEKDITTLCQKTRDTVNGMLGACLAKGYTMLLTALPSVISVGEAEAGKTGLTVIKELAGAGTNSAYRDGHALTPVQLMQPLKESIDELTKRLRDKEQEIQKAISANATYLRNHPHDYVAPEPKQPHDGSAWDLGHSDDPGRHDSGKDTLGEDGHE